MFVVAQSYAEAIAQWEQLIASENDGVCDPPAKGIHFVAEDSELLIPGLTNTSHSPSPAPASPESSNQPDQSEDGSRSSRSPLDAPSADDTAASADRKSDIANTDASVAETPPYSPDLS